MEKKIISNGDEYVVELLNSPNFGKRICAISYEEDPVYAFTYSIIDYKDDYVRIVKDAMMEFREYEKSQAKKRLQEAEAVRKFEEWDGVCE